MAEVLDEGTRGILGGYLREVRALPNESAKRQRFAALLGELFPGEKILKDYARGSEWMIRVKTADGTRRGFADAYYGNVIIEFENSLDATLAAAEEQLREYASGLWVKNGENAKNLIAVASDGITWKMYRPVLREGAAAPCPADITLDPLREIRLTESALGEFWLWLNQVLFRAQQIAPSAASFQNDFGSWSPLYRGALDALENAWAGASGQPEARLAFETWQKYLTVTYGKLPDAADPRLETLFLKHTYLCSLARLLAWAALSKGKFTGPLRSVIRDVLAGEYFRSVRIANMVEDDFFHWIRGEKPLAALAGTWERVAAHILDYDLARLNEDVLKGVYQQLIDPEDRHELGEYYTPDWLCERIVAELLPKYGFKPVLDPSCGSGGFLRAAIGHYLAHNPGAKGEAVLRKILENVQGIDIHPVAVTISRATYVLALGPLARAAKRRIQIPVYLADALFLPTEVGEQKQTDLYEPLRGIKITFGQRPGVRTVVVPQDLINEPKVFDEAISACADVAEEHARTGQDSRRTLGDHLAKAVPDFRAMLGQDAILDALWQFTEGLADLIRRRGNSIWAFIVRNSYRPAMLRGHFDVIVGNPPWLSYRYIGDPEYQAEIKKRAVEEYAIAPKLQKLFTHMELATVFYAHAIATFARSGAHIGFVMPRAVLSADQHQNLIRREYTAPFRLTGYWDLAAVAPLFNVPACVLFGTQSEDRGSASDPLDAVIWDGNLPERNVPWTIAKNNLALERADARTIYLGSRCAISTEPGADAQAMPSPYQKAFRQGATIVPRSFYFVRIKDLDVPPVPDKTYWAETDPEQARESKEPYRDIELSAAIEGRFIFSAVIAKHILPFAVLEPATVVLPLEEDAHGLRIIRASALTKSGYREAGKWFREAERIWTEKRGAKAGRQDLYQRLDYQRELTRQGLRHPHLVLYNAAGTNLAAARRSLPRRGGVIIDHKLYWAALETREEADYLVAVLNSASVNAAIKPFQSRGLLGERDVHKKVLSLPIPHFDCRNADHRRLAELGGAAHAEAARTAPTLASSRLLGRQRAAMRVAIGTILAEIDAIVRRVLGPSA